jgi:hypothetical protein
MKSSKAHSLKSCEKFQEAHDNNTHNYRAATVRRCEKIKTAKNPDFAPLETSLEALGSVVTSRLRVSVSPHAIGPTVVLIFSHLLTR